MSASRDVQLTALTYQCGVTFKASESHMFNTGIQPFVVQIRKCVL